MTPFKNLLCCLLFFTSIALYAEASDAFDHSVLSKESPMSYEGSTQLLNTSTKKREAFKPFSSTQYGYIPSEFLEGILSVNEFREGWLLQQNWGISLKSWLQVALGARMEYYYSKDYCLSFLGESRGEPYEKTQNTFVLLTGAYLTPFQLLNFRGFKLSPRLGLFGDYSWRNQSGHFSRYLSFEVDFALVVENTLPTMNHFSFEAGIKNFEPIRPVPYLGLKINF